MVIGPGGSNIRKICLEAEVNAAHFINDLRLFFSLPPLTSHFFRRTLRRRLERRKFIFALTLFPVELCLPTRLAARDFPN